MQTLYEQANNLVEDAQAIADNFNPNSNDKKMSTKCIQHMIATLARDCAIFHGDVEEKDKK